MKYERNLPELLEEVNRLETGHSDTQERAIRRFLELVTQYAAAGERVEIHGFGVFEYREMKGKTVHGIDGHIHEIAPEWHLKFRCAEKLQVRELPERQ